MIDIKQLRIGSHINADNIRAKVVDINKMRLSIADYPYRVFVEGTNSYGAKQVVAAFANNKKIQPIPLTAELLHELGFEHGDAIHDWDKYIGNARIDIHFLPDKERLRVYVINDSDDYGNTIVRYLHELENFIYHTIEKELIE